MIRILIEVEEEYCRVVANPENIMVVFDYIFERILIIDEFGRQHGTVDNYDEYSEELKELDHLVYIEHYQDNECYFVHVPKDTEVSIAYL
ncbi:hypothetical protein ABWW58_15675 [Sporolactobacillus sp. STCC-11]|uniref:hypothetical protein n=1 Tax=Sporolactobacillus caesalpiniae TaxID=3230362 RepID=UPI00339A0175